MISHITTCKLQKKEVVLLWANNLWYLSEGMLGPLFSVYCTRFGSTPFDISWLWAIYMMFVGVVIIFMGYMSDYLNKEKLLLSGYALQTVFTFFYVFIETKTQLAFLQVGLGISGGISTTTWYALYAKYEDKSASGMTWGLAQGLASIYTGIAVISGGLIIHYASFKALFLIMSIVQMGATIYLSRIFKSR